MVLNLSKLVNNFGLSETEYEKLKDFFRGKISYENLGALKQIIQDFDKSDSKLSLQQLGRLTDLKQRLVEEQILTNERPSWKTHMF